MKKRLIFIQCLILFNISLINGQSIKPPNQKDSIKNDSVFSQEYSKSNDSLHSIIDSKKNVVNHKIRLQKNNLASKKDSLRNQQRKIRGNLKSRTDSLKKDSVFSKKYSQSKDSLHSKGGHLLSMNDSIKQKVNFQKKVFLKKSHIKDSTDYKNKIKGRVISGIDSQKHIINKKIRSQKNGLLLMKDSLKIAPDKIADDLKSKRDSFVSDQKSIFKTKTNSILTQSKHPFDTAFHLNEKLKKMAGTKGSIYSESYTTNYLLPIQPGEKTYSRLYGNSTLTLFQLPFNVDFYLTTEKQTLYNANSFSLSFDADQFKQNLEEKARQKIKEKTAVQGDLKRKILGKENDLKKLSKEVESKKQKLASQEDLLNDKFLDQEVLKQKASTYAKNKIPSQDSLKGIGANLIEDAQNKLDEEIAKNGATEEKLKLEKEILILEQRIALARKAISILKQSDSTATKEIEDLKEKYNNPTTLIGLGKKAGKYPGLNKALGTVSSFNIGVFNPKYSPFSLSGITVKGVNTSWDGKSYFGNFTIGNTYHDQIAFNGLQTERPAFDRRLIATILGYGDRSGTNAYLTAIGIKDKESNKPGIINSLNAVIGTGGQFKWSKYATIKTEGLYSHYQKNYNSKNSSETTVLVHNGETYRPISKFLDHVAYNLTTSIFLTKNSELKTTWKWVGPGYKSLGSPYMRTNYDEREIALKWKLFKSILLVNGFYKINKAYPRNYREGDNKMSGFGVNARTSFKKLPNIFLSFSPYEQGNNTQDTLLRSNNKFSILMAGISYRISTKTITAFGNIFFTKSHTEFQQLENRVGDQYNLSFSGNVEYKQKLGLSLMYTLSKTSPSVDSLNNYRIYGGISYSLNKKVKTGIQYQGGFYNNGSYIQKSIASLNYTYKKSILFNFKVGIGEIKGIYEIDKKIMCDFLLEIGYNW